MYRTEPEILKRVHGVKETFEPPKGSQELDFQFYIEFSMEQSNRLLKGLIKSASLFRVVSRI